MSYQNNNHKIKRIPAEERFELRYDDVTRRAAAVARMIDRVPDGVVNIRIEKYPSMWSVTIEQLTQVQTMDLTQ